MKNKLAEWASAAEIVGAVAVTLSLVFVGLQIRGNTRATQAATFQASVGYDIELLLGQGRTVDTARIVSDFLDDPDSLSPDELLQGRLLVSASLRHMENLYLQHEAGMLSDEAWAAREELVRYSITSPGFGLILDNPVGLSGEFIEYARKVRGNSNFPRQ